VSSLTSPLSSSSPTPASGGARPKGGSAAAAGDDSGEAAASETSSTSGRVRSETEELLDSILPPREWEEDCQLWRQSVSSTPATRLDVINLQVGGGCLLFLFFMPDRYFADIKFTTLKS
jgi:hypothetical protein